MIAAAIGPMRMPDALAGSSPAMRELVDNIGVLAERPDTAVLILGEYGVGKGAIAASIHEHGQRAGRPFVELSCLDPRAAEEVAAPDDNGARARAEDGSLFLGEVWGLPETAQRTVAGWLAEGSAGGPRIMASSSRDLVAAVNDGAFGEDLYYRLAVMAVHVPPLRAREPEDLLALLEAIVNRAANQIPDSPRALAEPVTDRLVRYPWPGNLREMRNIVERAMISARGAPRVLWEHLPAEVRDPLGSDLEYVPRTMADVERIHVERTLRAHRHNRTRAAEALGISRATLIKKIKEYGLGPRPRGARQ